jgi:hypothetical protein
LPDPPKFTQIEIFDLKICHLATLVPTHSYDFIQNANEPKEEINDA